MTQLPTDRTSANSVQEHVDDHNTLATEHNELDGHAADTTAVHGIADTSALALTGHAHASNVFTAEAPPAYQAGLLYYGSDNEALGFYNNEADVILNIGQEVWLRVRNSSGSTISNGQAVYVNGNHAGTGLPTVALAKADALTTAAVVGLATHSIENNTVGYVTVIGIIHGLNTSGFSNADRLFLSATTAGALTATEPSLPNISVAVAVVTKAASGTGGSLQVLLRLPATPLVHAATHNAGGGDALAIDAAAATGSLRTLGTGAAQAAAGSHAHSNYANIDGAGTGAVAAAHSGDTVTASSTQAIAVGKNASANTGTAAIAIGGGVSATAAPQSTGTGSIAIGASNGTAVAGARASDTYAIAIGAGDTANAGPAASASDAIAVGRGASASVASSVAVGGFAATSGGSLSTAVGYAAAAAQSQAVGVGAVSNAAAAASTALGSYAQSTGTAAIAIGGGTGGATAAPSASGQGAIAIGASNDSGINGARTAGPGGIAIGSGTAVGGGVGASAASATSVAIGGASGSSPGAAASAADAVAIGRAASAAHARAVALGQGVATTTTDQVNLGTKRLHQGTPNTAPADADLVASQASLWLDESGDVLSFKAKRAAGTVLSGGLSPTTHAHSGTYVAQSLFDAAGDLLTATANDTPAKLSMGSALQVLRVNAGATALEYADPPAAAGVPGEYGDGSDGVINFDGSTTVLGLAPSSSVYTLTRDIYLDTGSQVSGSAVIKTANFRIFCRGTFTIGASAIVHADGNAGAGATAGAATTSGSDVGGAAGGAGNAGTTGGSGSSASTSGLGAVGGKGGSSSGGPGTGGGASSAGSVTNTMNTLPRALPTAFFTGLSGSARTWQGGSGGSGGDAAASSTGGGGGAGGNILHVTAYNLVATGTVRAAGGKGGDASGAGTGAGGGGGGGGGGLILVYHTKSGAGSTFTAATNAPGGGGGALQGAGKTGAAGSNGNIFEIVH